MNTIALRNEVQAAIYPELVAELTGGHWKGASPHNHGEDWQQAEPVVDPHRLGRNFEPAKDNYDLLNREAVERLGRRAIRKVKTALGQELTIRDLRRELKDMMFIMRTPRGEKLATSHQGLMSRPGRPSREDLQALSAPKTRTRSRRSHKREDRIAA